MDGSLYLANIISLFHSLIIIFILVAPFTSSLYILILHITFSMSLLLHWYHNSNVCALSIMESQLRGLDYTESYTHKFIAPMYDISKTTWSEICYIITIILMFVSIYRLWNSERWSVIKECYEKNKKDRLVAWIHCLKLLF